MPQLIRATAACAALIALAPHAARAADAGCLRHTLTPGEELDVRVAAGAVVPRTTPFQIVDRCVTPTDTYAWIATGRSRSREAESWHEYTCRKGPAKWSCGDGEYHQVFAVQLKSSGRTQPLEAISHDESDPEPARQLAAAALQLYADPAAHLPECTRTGADARDFSSVKARPMAADAPVAVDVWNKGEFEYVDFELELRLVFAAKQADARNPVAKCWAYVPAPR